MLLFSTEAATFLLIYYLTFIALAAAGGIAFNERKNSVPIIDQSRQLIAVPTLYRLLVSPARLLTNPSQRIGR